MAIFKAYLEAAPKRNRAKITSISVLNVGHQYILLRINPNNYLSTIVLMVNAEKSFYAREFSLGGNERVDCERIFVADFIDDNNIVTIIEDNQRFDDKNISDKYKKAVTYLRAAHLCRANGIPIPNDDSLPEALNKIIDLQHFH